MSRTADDQTFFDDIEGYCGRLSYVMGDVAWLHVSTRAVSYSIVVERWGNERTEVWAAHDLPGRFIEPPSDADSDGCRWPAAVEIPIGDDWRPGFHLVTMTAHGARTDRRVAHSCFVVRPLEVHRAKAVLVLSTNTWNAYNTWGGKSLYTGGHQVSFRRPFGRGMLCRPEVDRDDRKSRPVRFRETPDTDGAQFQSYRTVNNYPAAIGSAGWFTHERRFVEWAEANGFDFDVAVSADLETPGFLDGYALVISVGHDEYWSAAGRDAVDTHVAGGGNLATFSGNTMFWQVRLAGDSNPTDHMICHKYSAHETDPVVADGQPELMTGMWADPLVGRPEWSTIGGGSAFGLYHRFGSATPQGTGGFLVVNQDHWLVANTGLNYGDLVGRDDGVVGYETLGCPLQFDHEGRLVARAHAGLPDEVEIVGFTLSSNLATGEYPASISALSDQGDLEFVSMRLSGDTSAVNLAKWRRGNAVMLTCRPQGDEGGVVVTVGTTDWVFGLSTDAQVSQITRNVLNRLGAGSV